MSGTLGSARGIFVPEPVGISHPAYSRLLNKRCCFVCSSFSFLQWLHLALSPDVTTVIQEKQVFPGVLEWIETSTLPVHDVGEDGEDGNACQAL
ncbi:hypothetical protein HFO02_10545 [Rhizobium laguerreae]|uniref:hypothetical protein n=1 Tax=Rhizobium laguerreae TaxID=1076926 RepID=UPI001C904824|nr:hypothetical protein [Rhizobium laguerreae]MBY3297790.1 hypothetical protein [Rhizobium laguerreae]MBY3324035.1 hypothetical protein [Rhizobium laguerreae]MBY3540111.1 hypothetical protein [Rhizobium laguerreae]